MRVLYARPYGFEVGSVHKYAVMFRRALSALGHEWMDFIGDEAELQRTLRDRKPDLAIVGGDHWTHWRACLNTHTPYIVCEHDITSLRGAASDGERPMLENAAAVLFTSEDHLRYCENRYDLYYTDVIHLRPLASALDFKPLKKLRGKHMVYAGGIIPRSHADSIYGYRAYHDIFAAFMERGWTVHVYPCYLAPEKAARELAEMGCVIHEQVPQDALPRECSQYKFGLQAYAEHGDRDALRYTQTCRPNKTWEYLAAGIPTLGYNAGHCSDIYAGRWGVTMQSLSDVDAATKAACELRITDKMRREQVIDGDLPKFARLIDMALTAPKRRTYRLGIPVTYEGRLWMKGDTVDHKTAIAMRDAGLIAGRNL